MPGGSPCCHASPVLPVVLTLFMVINIIIYDMSSHQTTDNRTCVDEYIASDGESSDDEIEEALLVERRRETLLHQSQFFLCLSTLDE